MRASARVKLGALKESEKADYWMSYSDVMAALILMFVLLLTLVMLDYVVEKQKGIERVLGVRAQLIRDLSEEFKDSKLKMKIDPGTGAVTFPAGVFFAFDSDVISPEGMAHLEDFVPKYVRTILKPEYEGYLAQVIVEGHTDRRGSYLYNLDLSQRRAYAVVRAIFSEDFPDFPGRQKLQEYITANGRSYTRPVPGEDDPQKLRRVEFHFRLKEDEFIKELKALLGEDGQ
ncbi:MAG: OmpA family protein [Bacillota bacterium]|nr:OmpA family protein [Bacillota bacterium]